LIPKSAATSESAVTTGFTPLEMEARRLEGAISGADTKTNDNPKNVQWTPE